MTVTESRGAPSWTLLAVDGDPYILAALRRVVRPMGWRILTTGRAEDAMALLAIHPIDAVLSDLRMPDMDGLGLLEQVSRGWPRTACALMTDEPDAAMLINAINHGLLHGCIIKPWVDDELVSMLRRIRQRQQLEAATHVVERLAQKHRTSQKCQTQVGGRLSLNSPRNLPSSKHGLSATTGLRQRISITQRWHRRRASRTLAKPIARRYRSVSFATRPLIAVTSLTQGWSMPSQT